jgi:hypothetical protein
MATKVRLTETQLRRIIYEELVEHYLIQKDLWEDDHESDQQKKPRQMNKNGQSA